MAETTTLVRPATEERSPRDAANWARRVTTLHTGATPKGAINMVEGRHIIGPMRGFGPMWQKTYSIRLRHTGMTSTQVIKLWKANFPRFWPEGNHFYGPVTSIAPGDVALINADMPGGLRLSTGVMVLYADEESFTFVTPEGHLFAAWITFSAQQVGDDVLVQIKVLLRSPDPLMEVVLMLGGHAQEDRFWLTTLRNLADYLGAWIDYPEKKVDCIDRRVQWAQARNIRYNVGIRSTMYMISAPLRKVRALGSQRRG